jgi:signal transduction histidine kinase/CheY-like chemotaxis protein
MAVATPVDLNIALARATPRQLQVAAVACLAMLGLNIWLWPSATVVHSPVPGFVPIYQTTIIIAYALTAYLLYTHFRQSRVVSLLWVGGGALFTAMILFLQLLSFPNMLAPGRLLGSGPETTSWLWTFWHLGPPVFAIGFALAERRGPGKRCAPNQARLLLIAVSASLAALVFFITLTVTQWVGALPVIVKGDDYATLTTSGVGPAVQALTVAALGILWATTRLRTKLQLWVAVSLAALVLDNALTLAGASRGSIGWTVGRLEALVSASLLLIVYLHQSGLLHQHVSEAFQALTQSHATLEVQAAKLGETSRDLATAREKAEQENAAKSRFLAGMSHDFRTPLTAIIGFSDLLMQQDTSEADRRSYLMLLRQAASVLREQIGDVLDILKIESGRFELERLPFNLRAFVESSVGMVSQIALAKRVLLDIDLDPALPQFVEGDPTRLRQVLTNFLGNALKFTAEGSVTVKVEALSDAAEGQAFLRFAVRDSGIGIAEDHISRLFQDYVQAEVSTTRQFGGTGLGLSISRQIIEQMGGRVGVDSRLGEGSTFWFELALPLVTTSLAAVAEPEARVTPPPAASQPIPLRPAGPRRVLVVDDVASNQILLRAILERLGYAVDVAGNGALAVDAARRNPYDLILMDIQMPVLDGVAATKQIRASEGTASNVPIFALTASGSVQDASAYLAAGMQAVLGKPLNMRELEAMLERFAPSIPSSAGPAAQSEKKDRERA